MSLIEILKSHQEILQQAAKEMSDFQEAGVSGQWSLTFHYRPGGELETIKVNGRTKEFRIRPLR